MAAYERAMHVGKLPIGADRSKPGSVAAAVANYLNNSADFIQEGKLARGTKAARRAILNRFRDQYGELPIKLMHRKFISAMLAKLSAHAARNWFKAIRALCAFCVEQEIISVDPTIGMKAPKVPKSNGFHTWIEDEVDAYRQHYPIGTKARLALELGIMTLQRRGDVVEMGRQHIASGEVIKVGALVISKWLRAMDQQKTGTKYDIPIFPDLQHVLDATPSAHLTFLVTKTGKPYAPNDFSEQFRAWCDEAGLPHAAAFTACARRGAFTLPSAAARRRRSRPGRGTSVCARSSATCARRTARRWRLMRCAACWRRRQRRRRPRTKRVKKCQIHRQFDNFMGLSG